MTIALVLFFIGIALSAFFSGSEIGYYRATRIRLTMDATDGNWISRGLMWLANNPVMFVATTLVGNNLANNLVSVAIVMAIRAFLHTENFLIELMAPIALTPIVFVYGELLPKDLFYNAPNRLLRASGPFFLFCCLLFLPISCILWLLGRLLTFLVGESLAKLRASLARSELQGLFDEGEHEGVLKPAQRELAQNIFSIANQSLDNFSNPFNRATAFHLGTSKSEVFRVAHRNGDSDVLIREEKGQRILGYARIVDLHLDDNPNVDTFRPLAEISKDVSPVIALMKLQSDRESLAKIVDEDGNATGLVSAQVLTNAIWSERESLRR